MKKLTKFVTVYVVQGNYGGDEGWEDECCDTNRREALAELREYRINSPYPARMITRRVPRDKYESGEF